VEEGRSGLWKPRRGIAGGIDGIGQQTKILGDCWRECVEISLDIEYCRVRRVLLTNSWQRRRQRAFTEHQAKM
jgi:hypothetical protein